MGFSGAAVDRSGGEQQEVGSALGQLGTWIPPRMAVGAVLGAAAFLVEAGVAELILRSDRICREIKAVNWAFNPSGCQPEAVVWLLRGLSRGVVGALRPEFSHLLGAATMAAALALVAAVLGVLPLRKALPLYLGVQLLLAGAFGLLGYLVSYLAY